MAEQIEAHDNLPTVVLEGAYSPTNYLEEAVTLERMDYTIRINDGRIEVVFRAPEPIPDAEGQATVGREVERIFEVRMMLSGRPWEMSGLTLKRHYSDGRKDVWVSAASLVAVASMPSPDVIITDSDGNVITDTKAERLADARAFQQQCLRHVEDSLLKELLASFGRAVSDPADRMTHLYEIRDALKRHFGGGSKGAEKKTKNALGLTDAEWDDLGRIANAEPIEESRHRGSHSALRPASEDEQARVLAVARRMIRAYLDHLDRTSAAEDHHQVQVTPEAAE